MYAGLTMLWFVVMAVCGFLLADLTNPTWSKAGMLLVHIAVVCLALFALASFVVFIVEQVKELMAFSATLRKYERKEKDEVDNAKA